MRSRPPLQLSWLNTFLQPTHCPIKSAVLRDDDCLTLTGSITGSSPASETRCCTAPLPPTRRAFGEQSARLLVRRIMPVCTRVCVWMNISSPDPPLGGKGCFGSMAVHNPLLNEGRGGEDKHSRTMRPSFTPCCTHTHLKSAYPQCNSWLKWIIPHSAPPTPSLSRRKPRSATAE